LTKNALVFLEDHRYAKQNEKMTHTLSGTPATRCFRWRLNTSFIFIAPMGRLLMVKKLENPKKSC
jgi:hypothetical protein